MLSISQSLIKNYWSYGEGKYCGLLFDHVHIKRDVEIEPTPRMSLGHYFEFLCTGAKLRNGKEPDMPMTKTKKPTAEALRMQAQSARFKALVEKEGIVIDKVGESIELPFEKEGFKLKGIFDVIGEVKGEKAIIDIKSSGLIGNEWEEYGWHKSTFNMRKQLTIQVVFYKYLAWKVLGIEDMPFYFIIHSTTNEVDSLYWRVDITDFEVAMNHFEDMVFELAEEITLHSVMGFTAHPSVKRCSECPMAKKCELSTKTAELEVVTIDGIFE